MSLFLTIEVVLKVVLLIMWHCLASAVLKEFKIGLVFNEIGNEFHIGALFVHKGVSSNFSSQSA